jgi:hypothetical protein
MTTDYCSKTIKKRAKETTTEQDKLNKTNNDSRLHQQYKKTKTKSSIGGPRQTIGKQFQRSTNGTTKKNQSKVTMAMAGSKAVLKYYNGVEASCFCFRIELRHRFTSPEVCMAEWMNSAK